MPSSKHPKGELFKGVITSILTYSISPAFLNIITENLSFNNREIMVFSLNSTQKVCFYYERPPPEVLN